MQEFIVEGENHAGQGASAEENHAPAGGPAKGKGAKERGSRLAVRSTLAVASPPTDIPQSPAVLLDLPMIGAILPGPVKFQDYRLPPMKNVGRGPDGKVIQHFRSEEIALCVAQWASCGASENFICAMLNMRPGILRQLYHNELTHSAELANMNVASTAYKMATSGDSEAMTKFWLKSRNKWRDGENADDRQGSIFNVHIHV